MEVQATRDTGILNFEKAYLNLRQKENRIFDDDALEKLPHVESSHPHYHEWKVRQASGERLKKYLAGKKQTLRILEIGCGNGWLSHRLSLIPDSIVQGSDISSFELEQAQRVFGNRSNLRFIYGDVHCMELQSQKFDVIVFAASIQYFSSFKKTITHTLGLLDTGGEIHILDTHLYDSGEIEAARQRSVDYFIRMGFPELSENYFHHCINELQGFSYRILFKPNRFAKIFPINQNPFYWICITGKSSL